MTKLPQKYKFSFIDNVRNFFRKIFFKQKIEISKVEQQVLTKKNVGDNQIEKMRKDSNNIKLKEEIIELVQKNPKMLDTLSEERIDELNKICDEKIIQNDKKIKELEDKYNKLMAKVAQ